MLSLIDELKFLVHRFNSEGIPYALCGGLAMAVHAFPRATVDIDVRILAIDRDRVRSIAIGQGYTIETMPMSLSGGATVIQRHTKIERESGDLISLDLLMITPQAEASWNTREEYEWEGTRLCVVSRDGLILLKSLRGSGQDLADIEKLEKDPDEG